MAGSSSVAARSPPPCISLPASSRAGILHRPDSLGAMPTPNKILMGIYFYPRGGSAHVCRATAREFERNDFEVTVLSGSRSDLGEHALAGSFYSGLDLRTVDFTSALRSPNALRF